MLNDGNEIRALASAAPLTMPVLAVGAFGGPFTASGLAQVSAGEISATELAGVGHYVAQQAPDQLAALLLQFLDKIDH